MNSFILAVAIVSIACVSVRAQGALAGTYVIRGAKGPITLVIEQSADGTAVGTLKGGELSLVLRGVSQPDGSLLGAATTEQGQFASFFQAARQGGQLNFDLVQADQNGNPDMAKRSRIAFPVSPAPEPAVPARDVASLAAAAGLSGIQSGADQPSGPGAGSTAAAGRQPAGGPGTTGAWKIYQHAIGISVRYPTDWQLQELGSALQLVPPGVVSNAAGPTEAYLILGDGAQGIVSPSDPRVVQYFNQQIAQIAPFLVPMGQPEQLRSGAAPGILLTWEGTNPTGMVVRASLFVTILKGYAVGVLSLGDKARIAGRDPTVREIFYSLAAGAGQKDPAIVGAWRFWSYKGSSDGRFGSTTDRRLVIQADGACAWTSGGESSGVFKGTNSAGETTWTGGVAGQSNSGVDRGQWSAANGELYVLWGDGSTSKWNYQVTGLPGNRRLKLKGARGEPDEWVEIR